MASRVANESLTEMMDRYSAVGDPALWWAEGDRLRCVACGHRCLIGEGLRGICKVRVNEGGKLKVPFGYVAGMQCDPVEKKPFFHVYPGSDALTFGMLGCDLHCSYCQNWVTSQALRDAQAVAPLRPVTAAQIVEVGRREGARLVVSSYNEPLITAEWAVSVFRQAKEAGLACAFVSNGNATPEVLDFLRPWLCAYKIDLKSFNDRNYRSLGGMLDNITSTIRMVHERGLWLEIVTLVIPGFNDDPQELRAMARFLVSVNPDIPWHVTAFHKDYRMTDPDATPADTLIRAAEMGAAEGLRYVYAGNLPGRVGPWENTRCPSCRQTLIERFGFLVRSYRVEADGSCSYCKTKLPGVWPSSTAEVRTGNDMAAYQGRMPRRVEMTQIDKVTRRQGDKVIQGSSSVTTSPIHQVTLSSSKIKVTAMLTTEQKNQIVKAAGMMLRTYVEGNQATFPADLMDVGKQIIGGAFVSLKRGKHLRSCCGVIGQPVPLHFAISHASYRSALEDVRFPPISPSELPHLDMEVWLLGNPEPVQARGADRANAIVLGKHGIQVVQGQASGLFLPSVATENNWDVQRFLDQVCIKAGLQPTAWRDDATRLFTFEGEALRAPLADLDVVPPAGRMPLFCRQEDLPVYTQFFRNNLIATLTVSTPSYYSGGAPDGNLSGVIISVSVPGGTGEQSLGQISLRPGVPLQSTLNALANSVAQSLAAQRISREMLYDLKIDILLLHDAALHGTIADPHLDGLDPRHRAILVLERGRAGLVFDPERTPEELLQAAADQAKVTHPLTASVTSLDALSSRSAPVRFSTAPQPQPGPAVRPPAVAGTFYEAAPAELGSTVDRLFASKDKLTSPSTWPAAMVPHAGLRYSGRIAAQVLQRIKIPKTVIVIGPKHTPYGMDWAVAPQQRWALPGGGMDSDVVLANQLCKTISGLEMDAAAHQREHAIEVELPLLAKLAPQTKIVGIVVGSGDLESCRRFAQGLADVLRDQEERPLLLISSDMNHYATDAENRRLDAIALAALDRSDPEEVYETVTQNQISMCGVLPAVIVLETLRLLGSKQQAERVAYATSADVTSDVSRVVGYAGMLFQ
jgi:AmmeMemoRadiSam system radical SAM enzyme/AmmeMemoRadiSam system protein B/AmmeMemoRadiSam system protein A